MLPELLPSLLKDLLADPARQPELTRALRAALLGPVVPIGAAMAAGDTDFLVKYLNDTGGLVKSSVKEVSGKIGIGIGSAADPLDVAGAIRSTSNGSTYYAQFRSIHNYAQSFALTVLGGDATAKDILNFGGGGNVWLNTFSTTNALCLKDNGNVGVGTSSPSARLNVKARASFSATGTVAVSGTPGTVVTTVTGTSTSFTSEIAVGDRIAITINGTTYARTVVSISSNTSLTVDAGYHVSGSSLTLTVLPSIFQADNSSGTPQLTGCSDGNSRVAGFIGLGGSPILRDDDVGYVVSFFDNEASPFLNLNNEMRGYQATMNYKRASSADANVVYGTVNTSNTTVTRVSGESFITTGAWNGPRIDINGVSYVISSVSSFTQLTLTSSAGSQSGVSSAIWQTSVTSAVGLGWDVFGYGGAVVVKDMNLPSSDPNIRGQMKPFQSELYFRPKAAGAPNYNVLAPAVNYVASLTAVDPSCTVSQWTGLYIDSPCSECGATDKVTTGYGIWIDNLDESTHTLVAGNAAAIKIGGLNEYGRILWTGSSIFETSPAFLKVAATSVTLSGYLVAAEISTPSTPSSGFGALYFKSDHKLYYKQSDGTEIGPLVAGVTSLNGLTSSAQTFAVATGAPLGWSSSGSTHTLNVPDASTSVRGVVTTGGQTFAGLKTFDNGVDASGASVGIRHRYFSQSTRPTLHTGETAFWYRSSDGEAGLLHNDGSNYFWWHGQSNGGTVICTANP